MSWLGKLFGSRSATEWNAKAEADWSGRDYGRAKLAYESMRAASDATSDQRAHAEARVIECRDRLAQARLDEAETLAANHDEESQELARTEIRNALEIAASESLLQRARALSERLERTQAREHAAELAGDETDIIVAIAGTWEPEQTEEYELYEQALTDALVAMQQGRANEALPVLERLMKDAQDPHFLHFELGRAQLMTNNIEAGEKTLRTFLASIGPDEGGEARLVAHMELAGLAKLRGDFDGAVAELENAIEAMPEDPRAYVTLGVFLRKEGHASEAIEVLEAAQVVIGEARPEWRILQELGLAHRDNGDAERAKELLEKVIQIFSAQRLTDLPPETAVALAELHEKQDNKPRAADLYATLARGTDGEHLYSYTFNAGRLLSDLGQRADAMRFLQQAIELAKTPEERVAAETLAKTGV